MEAGLDKIRTLDIVLLIKNSKRRKGILQHAI
jgi:hypothetical protein